MPGGQKVAPALAIPEPPMLLLIMGAGVHLLSRRKRS
ncbi:MAG: PEP-CTERM sorting domain-containing protein [Planctomycetota bacterium]